MQILGMEKSAGACNVGGYRSWRENRTTTSKEEWGKLFQIVGTERTKAFCALETRLSVYEEESLYMGTLRLDKRRQCKVTVKDVLEAQENKDDFLVESHLGF